MNTVFEFLGEILKRLSSYILNMKVIDVPYNVGMVAVAFLVGYVASSVLVGFPCAFLRDAMKVEIDKEKENKITRILTICFGILFLLRVVWEKT